MEVLTRPPSGWPALVLNADFRPLSYYPLSIWPWQEVVKAVWQERVDVVSVYDKVVRSPSMELQLPSVISLKTYVDQDRSPAFTRFNVFLRDGFACQYCGGACASASELTFDHVIPRSRGGRTTWENIVAACGPCNLRKGGRTPQQASMPLLTRPQQPNAWQLQDAGRRFPPHYLHQSWLDYLYWDIELEP
ncbi:MAG: HNH endonuclease [Brevundimonas sp.]|uniref:HNH endonuclease n=1 Tax=Brevundimonas sp. TaxID=1871086 RepID=UPI001202B54F|nr:HNH endonuclease [Brevundimonas sp.]RZJ19378.1 MAG: HNH endonuclease [Brevundimonas sp.]